MRISYWSSDVLFRSVFAQQRLRLSLGNPVSAANSAKRGANDLGVTRVRQSQNQVRLADGYQPPSERCGRADASLAGEVCGNHIGRSGKRSPGREKGT